MKGFGLQQNLSSDIVGGLINATNPSASNPFTTLSVMQAYLQGLNQKPNATAATTTILNDTPTYDNTAKTLTGTTNNVALAAQDGVTLALNDLLLVKNQASTLQNGLYKVTRLAAASVKYQLTRQENMDISSEFNGAFIVINSGNANSGKIYLFNYNATFTMGADPVLFTWINQGFGVLTQTATVSAGATTIDILNGEIITIPLVNGVSTAITLTNGRPGTVIVKLVQDGTGSCLATWATTVVWAGGTTPTLTTTANHIDIVTLVYDGTTWRGTITLDFAS